MLSEIEALGIGGLIGFGIGGLTGIALAEYFGRKMLKEQGRKFSQQMKHTTKFYNRELHKKDKEK